MYFRLQVVASSITAEHTCPVCVGPQEKRKFQKKSPVHFGVVCTVECNIAQLNVKKMNSN
jgi:hypothetical protein